MESDVNTVMSEYYAFMGLQNSAELSEITRQYKDLIILWHPDKHYNDASNYPKYDELTKKLNEAYGYILNYHKQYGMPKFTYNEKSKDQASDTYFNIPHNISEPLEKCDGWDLKSNIAASIFNVFAAGFNAMLPIINNAERKYYENQVACVKKLSSILSNVQYNRHTIRLNNVSYAKKVNFADGPMIYNKRSGFFAWFIEEEEHSAKKYLKYLNDEKFCGIEHSQWRLMTASELILLILLARLTGYSINMKLPDTMMLCTAADIDGVYCDIDYLKYIQTNGKKFKDFLIDFGFYNADVRHIWFTAGDDVYVFDIIFCAAIDTTYDIENRAYTKFKKSFDSSACLWPVNNGYEQMKCVMIN